jgi:sec-independent protein translocase protein TatB
MGLFEMLIIAVVALLIVGPERMPEAVRGAAMTIGRLKRTFNSTKEEFEKQIGADDIRLELHNEQIMDNLKKMEADFAEIDSDLTKLTQGDEDRLFMEEDNYQDPPEFRGEVLHSEKIEREEPFAFNEPPADTEPSAVIEPSTVIEPSAVIEPLAAKDPKVNKKPSTINKPATKKPSSASKKTAAKKTAATKTTTAAKKPSTNSKPSAQQTSVNVGQAEDDIILNKNKSPV